MSTLQDLGKVLLYLEWLGIYPIDFGDYLKSRADSGIASFSDLNWLTLLSLWNSHVCHHVVFCWS
jgi:hypothetical protein